MAQERDPKTQGNPGSGVGKAAVFASLAAVLTAPQAGATPLPVYPGGAVDSGVQLTLPGHFTTDGRDDGGGDDRGGDDRGGDGDRGPDAGSGDGPTGGIPRARTTRT